ncbi:MAG: hypothetical protein LBW85_14335, partial [Deltaproteobacteria bacterium]|nr:hypothetical protein [Deltaproteobacteria bacterium]
MPQAPPGKPAAPAKAQAPPGKPAAPAKQLAPLTAAVAPAKPPEPAEAPAETMRKGESGDENSRRLEFLEKFYLEVPFT